MKPSFVLFVIILSLIFCGLWESQWRTEARLWTTGGLGGHRSDKFCLAQKYKNNRTLSVMMPVSSLVMGREEFGIQDTESVVKMPCWFDPVLARIGQKFARRTLTQIMITHSLSLFLLVANPEIRRILYFTMKSDNPQKAWKRYTATLLHVKLWYDEDIISSKNFFQSLQRVKNIHRATSSQLQEAYPDFTKPLLTQNSNHYDGKFVPDTKLWSAIQIDLELSRQLVNPRLPAMYRNSSKYHHFNQYIMTMTQFSFMAFPVLFPKQLLISASELELQGFVHLWAGISYGLGMNESYILCKDLDLTACRTYTMALLKEYFVPYLYHLDYESQVMLESLTWSIKLIVPPITLDFMILWLLEDILGIPCPNLRQYSGPVARMGRYVTKIFAEPLLHWPGSQSFANIILRGEIALSSLKHFGFDGTNSTIVADPGFYTGRKK